MSCLPLDYLDWCKEVKKAKSIEETERRDWFIEFVKTKNIKDVSGFDFMIAMGGK